MDSASGPCVSRQCPIWETTFSEQAHSCSRTTSVFARFAPCDLYLFRELKTALKETQFQSVEEVKAKPVELLKTVTSDELHHCFEQRKACMQRCINKEAFFKMGAMVTHNSQKTCTYANFNRMFDGVKNRYDFTKYVA